MKNILIALRVFIVMSVILGLVYPLTITGIAQLIFPAQANGSLIVKDGEVVGSKLIGQSFTSERYFYGRPSAIDYDASNSAASNYGPTNQKLLDQIKERASAIRTKEHLLHKSDAAGKIPADLLTAAASGLDPHISLRSALLQVPRVSKARKVSQDRIENIIERNKEYRISGMQNRPYINVLKVNLELDGIIP
ncbi:MAG: potassium-transporting ATPase subunit KdpC [Phycisphaerae bacterium]